MMASFLGQTQTIVELVNNIKIHPDIADCLGNSAVMYATVSTITVTRITTVSRIRQLENLFAYLIKFVF